MGSAQLTRPPPAMLWALGVAGVAAAAVSIALPLGSDHVTDPVVRAVLNGWVTLTYLVAGLVGWWRRPESRFGPLLVAGSFAMFLSSLAAADAPVPYTIGIAFDLLPAVLFLHVFLAFPSGRLQRRFERALVATGYAIAFGLQLVGLALGGFGPDNVLAITTEPDAAYTLLRVQLAALSACCLVGVGILATRRRGRVLRRPLALLIDSFAVGLVIIAVLFSSAAFGLVSGQLAFELLRYAAYFLIGLAPLAFLAGLLQSRFARAAVADLLIELRGNPAPAALRDAFAHALRDPPLTLVYWLPEFETWADVDGSPVELADLEGGRTSTVIEGSEGQIAALVHDPSLDDEPELLEAVAAAAAIALENARLQVEVRARVDELKGSRARIVEAADAERRRLERNLHDGAQQRMVAVALQLSLIQSRIRDRPRGRAGARDDGSERARRVDDRAAGAGARTPSRSARAGSMGGTGLARDALDSPGDGLVRDDRTAPEARRVRGLLRRLGGAGERREIRSCQRRHDARLARRAAGTIEIADDGGGGADDALGSGLRGLADRVEALDGRLRVSSPRGGGTTVTAELPCES